MDGAQQISGQRTRCSLARSRAERLRRRQFPHHIRGRSGALDNDIVGGYVGGLSAVHNMLILQTLYNCRYQNSFNLSQRSFRPGGSFGDIDGNVLLWGGLLSMREENRRYRPRFLVKAAVNQAIMGDQMELVQSGSDANDSSSITALYSPSYANRLESTLINSTIELKPIASYGYADGQNAA